jgi:hypothetical protein
MEKNWLERTELLIKENGIEKLQNANVLVVGLGGVGSFAAEFLTRAGIGKITIVDGDVVDITNVNRQLPALHSTVGKPKVEIVGDRMMDINPRLELTRINEFLVAERKRGNVFARCGKENFCEFTGHRFLISWLFCELNLSKIVLKKAIALNYKLNYHKKKSIGKKIIFLQTEPQKPS